MDCIVKLGLKFLGLDAVVKFPRKNPYTFLAGMAVLGVGLLFWLATYLLNEFYFLESSIPTIVMLPATTTTTTISTITATITNNITATIKPMMIDQYKVEYETCMKLIDESSSSSMGKKLIGKCCPEPEDCKCFQNENTRQMLKKSCPEILMKNTGNICHTINRQKKRRRRRRRREIVNNSSSSSSSLKLSIKKQSIYRLLTIKSSPIITYNVNRLYTFSSSSLANIITIILFIIDMVLFIIMIHTIHVWHNYSND